MSQTRLKDAALGTAGLFSVPFLLWSGTTLNFTVDFSTPWLIAAGAIGLATWLVIYLSPIHCYRILGLIPIGTTIVAFALAVGVWDTATKWTTIVLVFGIAIVTAPAFRYVVFRCQSRSKPLMYTLKQSRFVDGCLQIALLLLVVVELFFDDTRFHVEPMHDRQVSLALVLVLWLHSWVRFFRPLFELAVEAIVSRNYRVESFGPAVSRLPTDGPMIVIANHACWWDPLFLAKVLPRPVTPMMTSLFYDRWFLKPLMKYVFGTIRVEDAHVRREAPEIQQAIEALDTGACVIIFPEAFLRRKEEVPLRRFGRGIWEILKMRPETPVVACWIEGAWGSYSSYWNGPPTKNKTHERHRPIRIGISPPIKIRSELLAHHLTTRITMMNEVSAARTFLGLPPLPRFEIPTKEEFPDAEQSE